MLNVLHPGPKCAVHQVGQTYPEPQWSKTWYKILKRTEQSYFAWNELQPQQLHQTMLCLP